MSPAILSLLAVTFGFAGLVAWVYWPSRRSRMEQFAAIPLLDDQAASQKEDPQ